jgi:hypothetical protein
MMPDWYPLACIILSGIYNGHPMLRTRCFLLSVPKKFGDVLGGNPSGGLPFEICAAASENVTILNDYLDTDLVEIQKKDVKGKQSKNYLMRWKKLAAAIFKTDETTLALAADGARDPDGSYDGS